MVFTAMNKLWKILLSSAKNYFGQWQDLKIGQKCTSSFLDMFKPQEVIDIAFKREGSCFIFVKKCLSNS